MSRRLRAGERLVVATHNQGKLREIAELLEPWRMEVLAASALGLAEPVEDAADFVGNARIKARAAAQASGIAALADDSGFCVAALGGRPGVHSARWAVGGDFAAAMERVWAAMDGAEDRRVWFVCALCLAWPDGTVAAFQGRADGVAVWPPRGDQGFGYDPMFVPQGGALTYGEMAPAAKHASSHRARAFVQFRAACLG